MINRRGEYGYVPFRCDRLFNVGMKWFFATREGKDEGPFDDKHEANVELSFYLRERNMAYSKIG